MLINLVAGLFLLAAYVYLGLSDPHQKRWIPGFGMTGGIALTTGLHMIFTWAVTGSFNIAYGEMSIDARILDLRFWIYPMNKYIRLVVMSHIAFFVFPK